MRQLAADGTITEISPLYRHGPALTVRELEKIKVIYAAKSVSDDATVSPPSTLGPGITTGELNKI